MIGHVILSALHTLMVGCAIAAIAVTVAVVLWGIVCYLHPVPKIRGGK